MFCNIANGVHAHSSVNVDNAAAIGDHILEKMGGEKKLSPFALGAVQSQVQLSPDFDIKSNVVL